MIPVTGWVYRVLMAISLVAAIWFGKAWYDKRHYDAGYAAAEAKINQDALARLNAANEDARRREQGLIDYYNVVDTQRDKDLKRHEKTIANLLVAARDGDFRLRADVDRRSLCGIEPGSGTALTAGSGDQTRADLVPGLTQSILRIAADSAASVRRYNDLLDLYNRARDECNAVDTVSSSIREKPRICDGQDCDQ